MGSPLLNECVNVRLSLGKKSKFLSDKGLPKQYTENRFELQKDGKVIYDKATGLMWQQSGSEKYMIYDEALNYIRQLNQEGFAGYNDWRLPTLREAITLLKPEKPKKHYLFFDLLFDDKQKWLWTFTFSRDSHYDVWIVDFIHGDCRTVQSSGAYVRAVR